jgi:hypothetical protein
MSTSAAGSSSVARRRRPADRLGVRSEARTTGASPSRRRARALGIAQRILTYAEVTSFAVAEIALVAGAAGLAAWGALATDAFFVLFVLNSFATLICYSGWADG